MLADAIDLLDRQVTFLLGQRGPDFFMHLPGLLEALRGDPRIATILDDLAVEAEHRLTSLLERRAAVKASLLGLREQIVAALPDADDSDHDNATWGDPNRSTYEASMAYFNELACQQELLVWRDRNDVAPDAQPLDQMLSILQGKAEGLAPGSPICSALKSARATIEHLGRSYGLEGASDASVATVRLQRFAAALNPEPEAQPGSPILGRSLAESYGRIRASEETIREYVFGADPQPEDQVRLSSLRQSLRSDIRLFYMEARRRLGLSRSLRGIVDRYKMRAEWHDAAALRELAAQHKSQVEVMLTANFARYLHDQGLNPLTKIRAGGLEPDVLAPFADRKIRWTFYAEAKQYSKACLPYLAAGIREIADHLTRLRGTAFEVHEAFYMVFRLGGPLYHLPESVRLGDVTVYPVLIDIAEPKKSGSRQRETPVVVTVEELVPGHDVTRTKSKARGARGERRSS